MADGTKRLNIVVSEELHRQLKICAFENGVTLASFVAEAIAEKIEREKKKEG